MRIALTGPDQPKSLEIEDQKMDLLGPTEHEAALSELAKDSQKAKYAIDFCKGAGVANRNAEMYCRHNIPFVMGSTGADYKLIEKIAEETKTPCVAYPNMDIRIVTWMAGIEYMAQNYAMAFKDSKISLSETHQADKVTAEGKPETSGTMKNMLKTLSALAGEELTPDKILSIRDPNVQSKIIGVPDNWLGWHAYHFFKVSNEHDGVEDSEELIFKRHGGECYRRGTMVALAFLVAGKNKRYFNTMIDVLKAERME
jgi:4-hydroxy-tetrahydrodipicolinate reductase